MANAVPQRSQVLVLWVLWFAMTCAIVFYQVFLGHGWLKGDDARPMMQYPVIWLCVAWLAIATTVRWAVIPRVPDFRRLLFCLIIGLAFSESVEFFSLFLFPSDMPTTKMGLFVLSVLSALQFMPIYARNLVSPPSNTDSTPPPPWQAAI